MKNIERFNIYTAHVFGILYESFPVARMVHFPEVFNAVKPALELRPGEEDQQNKFFANTMMWLEETDYIRSRGQGQDRKMVLTPRAFEAMAAPLPIALRADGGSETVGEALAAAAKEAGADLGRETRKQVVAQLVGRVIGYLIKSATGGL